MPGSTARRVGIVAGVLLLAHTARASSLGIDGDGNDLHWPVDEDAGGPRLPVAVATTNTTDLDPDEVAASVARGLERWARVADGTLQYDVWAGDDPEVYVPQQAYDGLSTVFFASQAPPSARPAPHVAGHTQVWFDPDDGAILEADIVINDVDWRFTADPSAASYTGGGVLAFDDVLQHELGHAWGLAHSAHVDATMYAAAWSGQVTPHCDDVAAVRTLYGLVDGVGVLSGRVVGPRGPVDGASVIALSRSHGAPFATAVTAADGSFRLEGLRPGEHALWVEPTAPGIDPATQHPPCEAGLPARTPVAQAGRLRRFQVGAGVDLDVGELRLACTPDGGAAVAPAPAMLGGDVVTAFAVEPASERTIRLDGLSGPTEITAVGWSLWSPVALELDVLDVTGRALDVRPSPVTPDLGLGDARLRFEAPADGVVDLVLRTARLTSASFPLGGTLDPQPFVLLTVGADAPIAPCSPRGAPVARSIRDGDPERRSVQAVAQPIDASACGCAQGGGAGLAPWLLALALRRRAGARARAGR